MNFLSPENHTRKTTQQCRNITELVTIKNHILIWHVYFKLQRDKTSIYLQVHAIPCIYDWPCTQADIVLYMNQLDDQRSNLVVC